MEEKIPEEKAYGRSPEIVTSMSLVEWFVNNGYSIRTEWGDGPRNKLPQQLLAISPAMRRAYSQYGRIISFDLIRNLLEETADKQYIVGIFSTLDGEGRFLVCGVALLTDNTTEQVTRILRNFIDVHKQPPLTLVSEHEQTVVSAIDNLQNEGVFRGDHNLSTKVVCQRLLDRITNTCS